ncbi:hypothetical protein HanRHA438_Chr00c13g0849691 [Helianthus annuus]|nr:hypothetical protein HanHA300_Chr13g0498581 [Helianthus annuus]KAJ0499177.1 hypothetical protein HanHA89_Chr13g0531241 [Helianthus annuus]KAJ0665193.1 hypothetical protein HanLR1_Chr13g0501291 [Helianthus annuus]KAJ0954550.1 hypothetical protein HanRHA438_Chr00c13g0849691 [Helianthus annuus]
MGDKTDTSSNTTKPSVPLHPVYTVTDITKKVRILDGVKVTYSAWVKLFNLHARGYEVLDHITNEPPAKDDPTYAQWMKIDAVVLQWIYSTLSDEYVLRVLEEPSTALQAWNRVKDLFHNNKGPRCAALQSRFVNLKLSSMSSLEAYCQALRDLAAQLDDVGSPVNEQTLVLQLVRGLPREYDTIGSIINRELPSWNEACEMLRGDLERQTARDGNTPTSEVHAAVQPNNPPARNTRDNPPARNTSGPSRFGRNYGPNRRGGPRHDNPTHNQSNPNPNTNQPYGNTGQTHYRSGAGSGSNTRGQSNRHPAHNTWNPSFYPPMPPPYWPNSFWTTSPPPCPYPTQPGWVSPWTAPQQLASNLSDQSAPQAHITDVNPLEPTELAEAFNTMALEPEAPTWFMDTGASDHLTRDSGLSEWDDPESPRQYQ